MNPAANPSPRRSPLVLASAATVVAILFLLVYRDQAIMHKIDEASSFILKHGVCELYTSGKSSTISARPPITRFVDMKEVLEDLSPKSDASWSSSLNTPQGGFLWIKYNETSNMAWGVSMFHAIHCLTLIRNMVQIQARNSTAGVHHGNHNPTHQSKGHKALDSHHVGHCFSYIAQVCAFSLLA